MGKPRDRVVELQAQLKICRDALERIKAGHRAPEQLAEEALSRLLSLDAKYPLQGLVGHERKGRPHA